MVGAAGFELATPCAQGRCATRLRYAPTFLHHRTKLTLREMLHNGFTPQTQLFFFGFKNSVKNLVVLVDAKLFHSPRRQFNHPAHRFLNADRIE
jgi:hypothetical protein